MASEDFRSEDLHLRIVSGPAAYVRTFDGPVKYVRVANAQGVLGYIWAADEGHAANWVTRKELGDDAFNAGVAWSGRLRAAKAEGLTPFQALDSLTADPGGVRIGRIVPGSLRDAFSVAELKNLSEGL